MLLFSSADLIPGAAVAGSLSDFRSASHPIPSFALEFEQSDTGPQVHILFRSSAIRRVWIESRRGAWDWEFVAITTDPGCLDNRPLLRPGRGELREYRARYFNRANPNDPWSPAQAIAVEPGFPKLAEHRSLAMPDDESPEDQSASKRVGSFG